MILAAITPDELLKSSEPPQTVRRSPLDAAKAAYQNLAADALKRAAEGNHWHDRRGVEKSRGMILDGGTRVARM